MSSQTVSAMIKERPLPSGADADMTLLLQDVPTDSLRSHRGPAVPAASSAAVFDGLFWSANHSFCSSLAGFALLPPAMSLLQPADQSCKKKRFELHAQLYVLLHGAQAFSECVAKHGAVCIACVPGDVCMQSAGKLKDACVSSMQQILTLIRIRSEVLACWRSFVQRCPYCIHSILLCDLT